jgi:glucose-1-phosphate cytidylyltransferase
MVPIGYRPIIWNIMKYYAHFGHKDFILCLGHKADVIKNYFVNYDETISNDFVYTKGGKNIELLSTDIDDWRITFVDTGINSNIGMRLMNVKEHLAWEEMFLANYSVVHRTEPSEYIDCFQNKTIKQLLLWLTSLRKFHVVQRQEDGM